MKRLSTFIAILLTIPVFAQQNGITSSNQRIAIPKKHSHVPNVNEVQFNMQLVHLEAPLPGGNSYFDFLTKVKKQAANGANLSYAKRSAKRSTNPQLNPIILDSFGMTRYLAPIDRTDPIIGGNPLDNTLAISNGGILLSAVNTFLWGYDVANDSALFKDAQGSTVTINFGQFAGTQLIPNPGQSFPFDPKLLYDPVRDRFIFVFIDGRGPNDSQLLIGFSSTNDPRDAWHVYSLPGNPRTNGNNWADYPAISINQNELFFTINMIIPNVSWEEGFDGTQIWQIQLDEGFNGNDSLVTELWDDIRYNGEYIRYICPVETAYEPSGTNAYFVSNRPWDAVNDTIFLLEITNTIASGTAQLNIKQGKSNASYAMPPYGRQADTPPGAQDSTGLQTNDARHLGALLIGNTIHYVGNTRDLVTNNAAIYHGIIENIQSAAPSFKGHVIAQDTLDLGYPKIAYAGDGNDNEHYVIGFNHTARNVFAGVSAIVYDEKTDEYSEIIRVKEGLNYVDRISGPYDRWGDYFGIQRKYNQPGRVWVAGFYALQNRATSTFMAELGVNDPIFLGSPETAQLNRKKAINKVYPNPSVERFTLQFEVEEGSNLQFEIYDLQGKLCYHLGYAYAKKGKNELSFDVSPLATGNYIVVCKREGQTLFSEKIVKTHVR